MHPKELVVVMVLGLAVWALARRLALRFMRPEDFVLRRNVWAMLTVAAFLAPSFWIYAALAFGVLAWAARRDSCPAALYLVAFAIIPPLHFFIPFAGTGQLFALSQARLLSLAVLLPVAVRLFSVNENGLARRFTVLDGLLLAFTVLQVILVSPYESFTNTMRRGFLFSIDTLLVYYVFSRSVSNRRAQGDVLASFVVIGAVYGAIGIFESFRGWLMYEQIGPGWGVVNNGAFLLRSDSLRAQASAGHSLTLGYVLAMVLGIWLFLRTELTSRWARLIGTVFFCLALYATHSRGPWITGLAVYFCYLFIAPEGKSAFFKGLAVFAVIAALMSMTPVGQRIIDTLPFIGHVDQENVQYRQRLAEESWRLVGQNPFFGNPFVAMQMEDLRQGQGIIDLMNAYAAVALFNGLVGLFLFAGFFLLAGVRTYAAQRWAPVTPELARMGAALVACLLGSFLFMATASVDWFEYVLAGLMAGYLNMVLLERDPARVRTPPLAQGGSPAATGYVFVKPRRA